MQINWLAILAATLVTLPVGFIWYNKHVFGTVWMKETGVTEESAKNANMLKIFGLTIFFSFMMAFFLPPIVIHQIGALQLTGGDPAQALPSYEAFINDYAHNFRTFKHGALHGSMLRRPGHLIQFAENFHLAGIVLQSPPVYHPE